MEAIIIWIILIIIIILSSSLRYFVSSKKHNTIEENKSKQSELTEESLNIEIKSLIAAGKKIQAIKMYMEFAGVGLKEAKDYVDTISKTKGHRPAVVRDLIYKKRPKPSVNRDIQD